MFCKNSNALSSGIVKSPINNPQLITGGYELSKCEQLTYDFRNMLEVDEMLTSAIPRDDHPVIIALFKSIDAISTLRPAEGFSEIFGFFLCHSYGFTLTLRLEFIRLIRRDGISGNRANASRGNPGGIARTAPSRKAWGNDCSMEDYDTAQPCDR
jgi:hypothetical protein